MTLAHQHAREAHGARGFGCMVPRPARPWFRFYVEAMRDPKMRRLTPAQRWLWVAVLSAARESCEPGRLVIAERVPMTESDLADYAGMRRPEIMDGLALMIELGMLADDDGTLVVPAWNDRQYESDDTTKRTRKHRGGTTLERSEAVPGNSVGTDQRQRQKTESETDQIEQDFDLLWVGYPRKEARIPALKAYRARRREKIPSDDLARSVSNFTAAMASRDPDKIMLGATFFGPNERWCDYLQPLAVVPDQTAAERNLDWTDRLSRGEIA